MAADVHFFMTEAREARTERADGLPGKLLGRFLPDDGHGHPLSYTLTEKNKPFVEKWVEEDAAHIGVRPGSAAALGFKGGHVQGRVTVKPAPKAEG